MASSARDDRIAPQSAATPPAATPRPAHTREPADRRSGSHRARLRISKDGLKAWWTKINNDWIFNLAGLLAYNFLMSTFPILLVLLAAAGFVLGGLAPQQFAALQAQIAGALPGANKAGLVHAVAQQLRDSAGILLAVGVVTAAFTGSRLFITIEGCFGIIFRLRPRDFLHQNLMAFGMLCLYVVLIPLIALGSIVPQAINNAPGVHSGGAVVAFFVNVLGVVISIVVAFVLFAAIYVVVPNRRVRLGEVWQGTLVASVLLVVYSIVFPIYESVALHPSNYGSVAGFAVVILVFFYYLALIMLIGAEINSWVAGQRQTQGDIATVLHEVQAHNTTRGAAGPTAGQPQEHLQGPRADHSSHASHQADTSGTGQAQTTDAAPSASLQDSHLP